MVVVVNILVVRLAFTGFGVGTVWVVGLRLADLRLGVGFKTLGLRVPGLRHRIQDFQCFSILILSPLETASVALFGG